MDKVKSYKAAVRKYFEDWVDYHPDEQTGIPLTIVEDSKHGHFFLLEFGMGDNGWVHGLFAHLQVTETGKVILFQNTTDIEILQELLDYDIAYQDLTNGWSPEWVEPVSYTHLRAHETVLDLVCRLLLDKKNAKPIFECVLEAGHIPTHRLALDYFIAFHLLRALSLLLYITLLHLLFPSD